MFKISISKRVKPTFTKCDNYEGLVFQANDYLYLVTERHEVIYNNSCNTCYKLICESETISAEYSHRNITQGLDNKIFIPLNREYVQDKIEEKAKD